MTLTQEERQAALAALDKYYGINNALIPQQLKSTEGGSITINASWDSASLLKAFEKIDDPRQHQQLLNTLFLLVCCLLESPVLQRDLKTDELFEQMKQRDYLRLYKLRISSRDGETIFIRNAKNNIRINNYSNWFMNEFLDPFITEKLSGIADLNAALKSLDEPVPIKKGRRASDPRVAVLLWGSYKLITDDIAFATPMPNNLCNFLITLLQLALVLPASPVIDTFWIRAQLRYIRSRPNEPRFPLQ